MNTSTGTRAGRTTISLGRSATRTTRRTLVAVLAGAAMMAGCSGGVDSGGSGSCAAPTVTYAGTLARPDAASVDVAGGVFALDYTHASSGSVPSDCPVSATVIDGIDSRRLDPAAMQPGMQVELRSLASDMVTAPDGVRHGDAYDIVLRVDVLGRIDAVDAVHGQLVVAGQSVVVDAQTRYGGVAGLGDLSAGQPVRIHGFLGGDDDVYRATRVDLLPIAPAQDIVTSSVRALDATAHRFHLGGLVVDYAAAVGVPALADGDVVQVVLAAGSGSSRSATAVRALHDEGPPAEAAFEGLVAHWDGAGAFTLPDYAVDAHAARIVDAAGAPATLAAGAHVIAHGSFAASAPVPVLLADVVTVLP